MTKQGRNPRQQQTVHKAVIIDSAASVYGAPEYADSSPLHQKAAGKNGIYWQVHAL
ncbi:hypothetical protein [Ralstonia wenshanensis]|uniref:hypothetical protein n=1 Tax=Ralstonia wenshanensis TaxID=2842456 RepID=UPI003D95B023